MTSEEENKTPAAGDNGEGSNAQTPSLIEQADSAAKRLAAENERMENNIRRQEELAARSALGGFSAGKPQQPEKEESPQEYAKRMLEGRK